MRIRLSELSEEERRLRRNRLEREWKRRNPDKIRAIRKRYYEAHKEQIKEAGRLYHQRPGVVERKRIAHNRWADKNPHLRWAHTSMYSHKRRGFRLLFSYQELKMLAEQTMECGYCGGKLLYNRQTSLMERPTLDRTEGDIVVRLEDVQIICHRCNVSKSNRTHSEFVHFCKLIAMKF